MSANDTAATDAEVQAAKEKLRRARTAAINLMEDALAARRKAEAAEQTLRESERRYRLLFDRNPDGVFAVDPTGRFILANPACELLSGYSAAELLRKTFIDLCAPDQSADTLAHFERSAREQAYAELETALIRKDGRRLELCIAGEPIVANGQLVAVHCTAKDITQRKRAEEELRASEELFRVMFTESSVGQGLADPATGRIVQVNAAFCQLMGYSQEEMCQRTFLDLHHPDDRPRAIADFEAMVRGETPGYHQEKRYLRADSSVIWVNVVTNLIRDATGRPFRSFALVQDITARKQAENALRESNQELEEFNQAMVGRELRMIELKQEINAVCAQFGEPPRYPLDAEEVQP